MDHFDEASEAWPGNLINKKVAKERMCVQS